MIPDNSRHARVKAPVGISDIDARQRNGEEDKAKSKRNAQRRDAITDGRRKQIFVKGDQQQVSGERAEHQRGEKPAQT